MPNNPGAVLDRPTIGTLGRLIPAPGPQRMLAASNLVFTVGSGMYLTAGVLYFTEAAHLPAARVALGLLLAGLLSLALGIVVGHLADRYGARGVYATALLVQAAATAAFVIADGFWPFVAAVSVATGAKAAGVAARSPLIRRHGGERPQQFRAYLRAVTNIGVSVGALFAGWAVQTGTTTAYDLMVLAIAALTVASAAFLVLLPPATAPPPGTGPGPRWAALRDRPYLLLTVLDGVMAIQFKVLTVAIPLWLIADTAAPHWLIAATMLTGTLMVIALQVPASRGITTLPAGAAAYRRAGLAFLAACCLVSCTTGVPAWAAATLLITAVIVHTTGELWHAAAGFEVSFALAPEHATGQYLGVFGLGAGLAEAFGPALLIGLCIEWGRPGWYVTGAMFAVTGAAVPAAVRYAERHRALEPAPQ
ncbi:MFS transporter [Dactylosporangium matsuzakiense]|uniref:MFS transporter n=1 Tax=Dactylosporangium matsuzakiense TaxID=53360 RepID=A0A9W6KTL9_9ACTN|nr:MFS transporter [Dactylosporangium matsuzakiense]UWZ41419.1 MFS transporter [Dactylosporangium matsuzakiense]GLL06975.1 MFS transporter [Dactylosporangium matsuzakiense]